MRLLLIPLLASTIGIFAIQFLIIQQPVYAAEWDNSRSVLFIDRALLMGTAERMSEDRVSALMSGIRKRLDRPQFDANTLPESLQSQFWENSIKRISAGTASGLSSLLASIRRVEQEIADADSRGDVDKSDSLKQRRSTMFTQRQTLEHILFDQVKDLMSETTGNAFRSLKSEKYGKERAETLGLTDADLRRLAEPAYICLVALTDYERTIDENSGILEYGITGSLIWLSFNGLSDPEPQIKYLKASRSGASISGEIEEPTSWSGVDSSEYSRFAFGRAIEVFASKLEPEILDLLVSASKTNIAEVKGNRIGIKLGKKDGIFVNQKFRVYETHYHGGLKKRGFFYITRVGDNTSDENKLSYGKLVARGAQPGMQISEYRSIGLDVSVRFMYGRLKIDPGQMQFSFLENGIDYALKIKEEINTPVYVLNTCFHYDIGRHMRIPQLFVSAGLDLHPENIPSGSIDNVSLDLPLIVLPDEYADEPDYEGYYGDPRAAYWNVYFGFLKKWYIGRIALSIEPLIQHQAFTITSEELMRGVDFSDYGLSTMEIQNSVFSFSPNVGMEFAIRENLDVGLAMKFGFPIGSINKWSGTYSSRENLWESENRPSKSVTDAEVTYPRVFIGAYLNYVIAGY